MPYIKQIAQSHNSTSPAIIFFHGLNGHGSQTWMSDPSNENTLWPKWLADDFDCSVFLVAYDAALSGWVDQAMPIPDQADSVLEMLATEPLLKNRPLVLVGHSMGGLVIKTAIHNGLTKGVERHVNIIKQVRGVVFVGTPHKGSELATLVTKASVLFRTNTQVKNMQNHDAHLRTLNQQFLEYYRSPPSGKVSVLTFAETRGVLLGKTLFGLRGGKSLMIVDPDSAEPHVSGEIAIRLPEGHISMCKLKNKDELLYKSLLSYLSERVDYSLEVEDQKQEAKPTEASNPSGEKASQSGITAGNITAGDGGIAVGVINGSVTLNNNKG